MRKLLFLIIFLFICGATFYYIDPLKLFSIADQDIKDIIDSEFELEVSEEDSAPLQPSLPSKPSMPSQIDSEHGIPRAELFEDMITKGKENGMNESPESVPVSTILDKYESTVESLQTQVEEKLNTLLEHAYDEYLQGKSEGKTNLALLYLKYKKAIDELELKTDESFEELYNELIDELKEHGYDSSEAKEIKEQYEKIKEETEEVMMERVMEKFEV